MGSSGFRSGRHNSCTPGFAAFDGIVHAKQRGLARSFPVGPFRAASFVASCRHNSRPPGFAGFDGIGLGKPARTGTSLLASSASCVRGCVRLFRRRPSAVCLSVRLSWCLLGCLSCCRLSCLSVWASGVRPLPPSFLCCWFLAGVAPWWVPGPWGSWPGLAWVGPLLAPKPVFKSVPILSMYRGHASIFAKASLTPYLRLNPCSLVGPSMR